VIIPGELKKGEFVEVEIIDAVDYDLIGELVTRDGIVNCPLSIIN
jgi:hypothetical protein